MKATLTEIFPADYQRIELHDSNATMQFADELDKYLLLKYMGKIDDAKAHLKMLSKPKIKAILKNFPLRKSTDRFISRSSIYKTSNWAIGVDASVFGSGELVVEFLQCLIALEPKNTTWHFKSINISWSIDGLEVDVLHHHFTATDHAICTATSKPVSLGELEFTENTDAFFSLGHMTAN